MNRHDDSFLQTPPARFEDPTPEELAEAEAQLAALPPMAPLGETEIAALMARIVPPNPQRKTSPQQTSTRQKTTTRRTLVASAALLLLLGAAGWTLTDLWPSRRHSAANMDYPAAVMMTTRFDYNDGERVAALGLIAGRCGYASDTLAQLANENSPVGAEAANARTRLAALIAAGTDRGPRPVNDAMERECKTAMDHTLPEDLRRAAIGRIEMLVTEGIRAVLTTSMTTPEGATTRDDARQMLAEMFH